MKGRLLALLVPLGLAASGGLWYYNTLSDRPNLACPAIASGESLAAAPGVILIDGAPQETARAAQAIGCAAAAEGVALQFFATNDTGAPLTPLVSALSRAGAQANLRVLAAAAPTGDDYAAQQADGDARALSFANAISASAISGAVRIVALASPDASRAAVGVAGHTWSPLGARLPEGETISLRAEASSAPGIRLKLRPFEDVPLHGAAMRYDGLIEIGPEAAGSQLRGR